MKWQIKPILMMIAVTLLTSTGQILWKYSSLQQVATGQVFNLLLLFGFVSYGLGSALLIIALKYGDLSMLYPFVALSFVWVSIMSIILFNEHVSILNWLGITAIIIGVSLIGYGSRRVQHG